ncbi:MAG: HAD family phosphatase [Clostridiales bacterium]|nr:HAD family phosphatase [Clostridiales bacterium]
MDRKNKAVIFDMDGVIFDSETCCHIVWTYIAEKHGIKDLDKIYHRLLGINSEATKKIFLEFYGQDFPYDSIKQEMREEFHRRYGGGRLPKKPYIEELLKELKDKGYKTAIASSTSTPTVRREIEEAGLIGYFDAIVGGDLVTNSKPDPEIFLIAAEKLGSKPEETYVIEDSYNGIRAAYQGKFIPVMVPDMLPPDEEMKDKAAVILDSLKDVANYIL